MTDELDRYNAAQIKSLLKYLHEADPVRLRDVLAEALTPSFAQIWEPREVSYTYWLLLMSGVNQEEELQVATSLLIWKAFSVKDAAKVLCIESADRIFFRLCSARFKTTKCPSLIVSDDPLFGDYLRLNSALLFAINSQPGQMPRFLTEIQSSIETGKTLADIRAELRSERFWKNLKVLYAEIKDLVSASIDISAL